MGAWRHSAHDETHREQAWKKKDIKQYNQPLYFSSVTWICSFRPPAVLSVADMFFLQGSGWRTGLHTKEWKKRLQQSWEFLFFWLKVPLQYPMRYTVSWWDVRLINDWLQTFGVQRHYCCTGEGKGCTNSCRISISWHNLARTGKKKKKKRKEGNNASHDKTLSCFCFFLFSKVRISFTVVVLFCIFFAHVPTITAPKLSPSPVQKSLKHKPSKQPQKKVFNFLQKKKKINHSTYCLFYGWNLCKKSQWQLTKSKPTHTPGTSLTGFV